MENWGRIQVHNIIDYSALEVSNTHICFLDAFVHAHSCTMYNQMPEDG